MKKGEFYKFIEIFENGDEGEGNGISTINQTA